jgi:hypothetical protein
MARPGRLPDGTGSKRAGVLQLSHWDGQYRRGPEGEETAAGRSAPIRVRLLDKQLSLHPFLPPSSRRRRRRRRSSGAPYAAFTRVLHREQGRKDSPLTQPAKIRNRSKLEPEAESQRMERFLNLRDLPNLSICGSLRLLQRSCLPSLS